MSAVFGYGSLIWKVSPFASSAIRQLSQLTSIHSQSPPWLLDCTPGYIKGHVRRFAQASHDHRGTPQEPGRGVSAVVPPLLILVLVHAPRVSPRAQQS